MQLPAILKAKSMGLQVIAVDMDAGAVGFKVPEIIKEQISTVDTSAILNAAKQHKIDSIMTLATDMPMQSVAVVCREMGLVGISEATALQATNKAIMRDTLNKCHVPIPIYYRVKEKKNFYSAVKELKRQCRSCIVKPADNSGSRGVILLNESSDLDKAYEYAMHYSRSGEIMVEEFMEGPEVSVETLAVDGNIQVIQITDKLTTGAPYFVEMGHSQPSTLSEETKQRIASVAVAANRAIGIRNGPSHTEIRVTNDGPKIVELGARLGGDCIATHLVPLSTGVDMVECCIRIALGEKPNLEAKWEKGAAIRYLDNKIGTICAINGIDDAESVPGIVQVSIVHNTGEYIEQVKCSNDRLGFVIAKADTAAMAVATCEKGKKLIEVEYKT